MATLCVADCMRHGPTLNGGELAAVGKTAEEDDGAGVDDLLFENGVVPLDPML